MMFLLLLSVVVCMWASAKYRVWKGTNILRGKTCWDVCDSVACLIIHPLNIARDSWVCSLPVHKLLNIWLSTRILSAEITQCAHLCSQVYLPGLQSIWYFNTNHRYCNPSQYGKLLLGEHAISRNYPFKTWSSQNQYLTVSLSQSGQSGWSLRHINLFNRYG